MQTGKAKKRTRRRDGLAKHGEALRKYGLSMAFLIVLIAGLLGFEAARQPSSEGLPMFDSLYRSLQMFVMGFSLPDGVKNNTWLTAILTFLSYAAVAVSSSAVIAVFARSFGDPVLLRWQAWRREHGIPGVLRQTEQWRRPRRRAVLLGFGTVNRAVAQSLKARNYAITAIDERFEEPAQLIARNNGVLLVAGDLTDMSSLERGRLASADIIVVAAGNDVTNIEIAAAAHALEQGANIYAHVASSSFADDLRESSDHGFPLAEGIRTFSVKRESARNLLRRAHLARKARECNQQRVHLVVVGMGDQGEAILLEALQDGIANDLHPPRITVIDKEADIVAKRFWARWPGLSAVGLPTDAAPIIRFVPLDIQSVNFSRVAELEALEIARNPVTAYVFCCGEDATNLAAGLRLENAMGLGRCPPATIFLTVWGAGIETELYDDRDPLGFCKLFGAVQPTMEGATFLVNDEDKLAAELHRAYEQKRRGGAGARTPERAWSSMPQTMKEANRRAVRHAHVKLIDLDLQWRGMGEAVLPKINTETALTLTAVPENLDSSAILDGRLAVPSEHRLMAKLAETEHRRWVVDRAMDGWQPVRGVRDNTARLHPNMVPFNDLEEADQHYDTVLLRALLEDFGAGEEKHMVARPARRSAHIVAADGSIAGPIAPDTTELLLVLPAQSYRFPPDGPSPTLIRTIRDWSTRPDACRLRLVLGQRFGVDIPHSHAAHAATYLRSIAACIPADVDLDVIHLYGVGPAANVPPAEIQDYLDRQLAAP
ncbi:MAG: NAD-binding protein [Alphaproteobacteria bacterium]|nr:NAD-binding protein [Alphaproteobacteria bacterium]MBU1563103.1 NAD-binding protein [Alphaproteobacteria bacterium]MBU2304297.1 NAD-binding protein [Alphaproteobacteria bacterium]MBU2368299.1 NAD-binding protein [Alphaproteobacteria bacterium]